MIYWLSVPSWRMDDYYKLRLVANCLQLMKMEDGGSKEARNGGKQRSDLGAKEESPASNMTRMDEMEDRLEDAGIVKAPDGGFGWAVVFASFCTNAVVDGVIFTVSASLVPRWERFFQSSSVTAITSLLAGFYLLSGPLASALANQFGCNRVAIAGSFVAAIGFLVSALLPALPILYFAFGIIGGVGYGLVFLPAIVIVGQYFSDRRALATGVAVCGSGIGTAIFGKLNPFLLDRFDALAGAEESWRLFLLFLAAVTLLCALFGYFFQPLKPSKSQLEQVVRITSELMGMDEEHHRAGSEVVTSMEKLALPGSPPRKDSVGEEQHLPHVTKGVEIERFEKAPQNGTLARKRRDTFSQRPFLSTLELLASRQAIDKTSASNANLALEVSKASIANLNRPLSRMDVFYAGSIASLSNRVQQTTGGRRMTELLATDVEALGSSCQRQTRRSTLFLSSAGLEDVAAACTGGGGFPSKWTHGIIASLRPMLDLSLLQSPTFLVLALSGFLTLFCFFVPFAFIGTLADDCIRAAAKAQSGDEVGVETEAEEDNGGSSTQLLLVLLGLFNVLGRVLCGLVADHPRVDPLMLSNIALVIGGLATAGAPFLTSIWMFALYCLPFAFGAASFAALRSIICVELLGIDRLTSAFGMLMLFMGVAALFGPPFAKMLKNFTGSYAISFHLMGILMALSGLLCVPLRRINEWECSRERRNSPVEGAKTAAEKEPLDSKQAD